jgi:ribosomal protein S6
MPAYELFCLARPTLARADLARMMQRVGNIVFEKGGVITNISSYDEQPLAYRVKKSNEKYNSVSAAVRVATAGVAAPRAPAAPCPHRAPSPRPPAAPPSRFPRRAAAPTRRPPPPGTPQAHMWQMDFVVQPQVLRDINHQLKVDEGVLRFSTLKRRVLPAIDKDLRRQAAQQQRLAEQQQQQQQPAAAGEQ